MTDTSNRTASRFDALGNFYRSNDLKFHSFSKKYYLAPIVDLTAPDGNRVHAPAAKLCMDQKNVIVHDEVGFTHFENTSYPVGGSLCNRNPLHR
jgi:hypothetical protein